MYEGNKIVKSFLSVLCVIGCTVSGSAENQTNSKFMASSELVLVPAIVNDRSGAYIKGLAKSDFVILEDGVERPISTFEEVITSAEHVSRRSPVGNTFTNQLGDNPLPRRITVIVLDFVNTAFTDQVKGRRQLLQYLDESLDVREPTALFVITPSGPKIIHNFTEDTRVLAVALKQTRLALDTLAATTPQGAPSEVGGNATLYPDGTGSAEVSGVKKRMAEALRELQQQFTAFQTRISATITLQSMQQIAHSLEGVPGRKVMIWMSGGFPFSISESQSFDKLDVTQRATRDPIAYSDDLGTMLPVYSATWKSLNSAQISVYPIDVRGIVNQYFVHPAEQHPDKNFIAQSTWKQNETLGTFDNFAGMTGGRAYYNSNDLKLALREAVQDSAQYYVLGYYLGKNARKEGWHKIEVRVRVADAKVRARSGFVVTKRRIDSANDLQAAIDSPIEYTGMPVTVRWMSEQVSNPGAIGFELSVPPGKITIDSNDGNRISIQILIGTKKADGLLADQPQSKTFEGTLQSDSAKELQKSGFVYTGEIRPVKDATEVRFILRDLLTGKIGTITAPLPDNFVH